MLACDEFANNDGIEVMIALDRFGIARGPPGSVGAFSRMTGRACGVGGMRVGER